MVFFYESDFTITERIQDAQGVALDLSTMDFDIVYSTNGYRTYTASKHGSTYTNCVLDEDDHSVLRITLDAHGLQPGFLVREITFHTAPPQGFDGNIQDISKKQYVVDIDTGRVVLGRKTSPAGVGQVYEIYHVDFIKGDSAYQIAVQNGFEGTESEWLQSLAAKLTPKGTYSAETKYAKNDLVNDADSSYVSLTESNIGNPLTDTMHWQIVASGKAASEFAERAAIAEEGRVIAENKRVAAEEKRIEEWKLIKSLPVEHEIPEEGMLPDVRYVLDVSSIPSLDITLQPGTPGRAATYHLVFRIFDEIPSITWPEGMYGAPTLEEDMLYEIDITDDGTYIIANAYSISAPDTSKILRYKTDDDSELEISFDGLNLKKSVFDGEYWNAQFDGVITEIKNNSIQNKYKLKEVILPPQLTTISIGSFGYCSSLTSVTIPDTVTYIGNYAFEGCSSLTSIIIPDSVTSIGEGVFMYCSSLTSVTIGSSITSIDQQMFGYCSSLTSVTIPDTVTYIGNFAFRHCSSLISVTIPDSVASIEENAFSDCSSLIVIIPDSVTYIGYYAFQDVPAIFYNGTATGSPWGALSVNPYIEGDFVFSDSSKTTLLKYLNKTATSVTIPDSVASIGGKAFESCEALTSIIIPDSVTSIGYRAFYDCRVLTSVTIGSSITSIGEGAFYNCKALTSIIIPDSIISIEEDAFYGCEDLTSVTIGSSITSIGEGAFDSCYDLTSATVFATTPPVLGEKASDIFERNCIIKVPAASVNSYKTASNWNYVASRIIAISE